MPQATAHYEYDHKRKLRELVLAGHMTPEVESELLRRVAVMKAALLEEWFDLKDKLQRLGVHIE